MAATTVDVAGHNPLSFTDSSGAQRFVPLSGFEFVGSDIQLKSAWAAEFSSADQQILLAIAGARATGGELTPPPVASPAPAVVFTASVPGPAAVAFVVEASAPPGGLALPAARDVQLSGGAPGIAATGVAYTS